MARESDIATNVSADGVLTITVRGFDPITVDPSVYTPETRAHAMAHGFKQKYVDAAALGAGSSLAAKHEAIMAIRQHHLDGGAWNRVAGQGDGVSGEGLLVRAIMEYAGIDRDRAREQVKGMAKEMQHAMRTSDELAPIVARLKAADDKAAAPKADTSGILARLRNMAP